MTAVASLTALLICAACTTPIKLAAWIAFQSDRDGQEEIYILNADGTGQTNISNDPTLDFEPVYSPNSEEIAVQSNRAGNPEIYVMDASGANVRRLTNNSVVDRAPDWK